ncbi:hypothetical protein B0H19DRAFT_947509 [Mycena capillaripes]|nr:hypothetical protein B0H19DRAFT_947509 [Mycena capillaripes]
MEGEGDEGEDGDDRAGAYVGKKHVCPTCGKRFNRPSSLRIHRNTHTGATPFRCPYPSCRRAFNVNSNMRRHFRNHTSSAFITSNWSISSPISPTSKKSPTPPISFSSHGLYPSSPSSYASSPISPPSASWSDSSSGSRFLHPTPPSSLPPHSEHVEQWVAPKSYRVAGTRAQSYSQSDARGERR